MARHPASKHGAPRARRRRYLPLRAALHRHAKAVGHRSGRRLATSPQSGRPGRRISERRNLQLSTTAVSPRKAGLSVPHVERHGGNRARVRCLVDRRLIGTTGRHVCDCHPRSGQQRAPPRPRPFRRKAVVSLRDGKRFRLRIDAAFRRGDALGVGPYRPALTRALSRAAFRSGQADHPARRRTRAAGRAIERQDGRTGVATAPTASALLATSAAGG